MENTIVRPKYVPFSLEIEAEICFRTYPLGQWKAGKPPKYFQGRRWGRRRPCVGHLSLVWNREIMAVELTLILLLNHILRISLSRHY